MAVTRQLDRFCQTSECSVIRQHFTWRERWTFRTFVKQSALTFVLSMSARKDVVQKLALVSFHRR
jgi:hypothetical protein